MTNTRFDQGPQSSSTEGAETVMGCEKALYALPVHRRILLHAAEPHGYPGKEEEGGWEKSAKR